MEQKRNKFRNLPVKSKLAYSTAILAFVVGWGLTIAAFCVEPMGEVHDSVLWVLGQSLLYAGGVFGVALYTGNQVSGMKKEIRRFMRNPHQELPPDTYDVYNQYDGDIEEESEEIEENP